MTDPKNQPVDDADVIRRQEVSAPRMSNELPRYTH